MNIIIRQETEIDYPFVHTLNKMAFGRADEADLVDALRKNRDIFIPGLSIVAIFGDEVAGHILFTRIKINHDNGEACESLALAPMAVKPVFQKKGIGGQLISKGIGTAKDLGFKSVIVVGHEHYYPRFGFAPAEKWNIRPPFEVPSSAFMAIELVEGGLKDIEGLVNYPKEFGEA